MQTFSEKSLAILDRERSRFLLDFSAEAQNQEQYLVRISYL